MKPSQLRKELSVAFSNGLKYLIVEPPGIGKTEIVIAAANPLSPLSGLATGSFNGLHPKSKFLAFMFHSYSKALTLGLAALACLLAIPAFATPITIDMAAVGNPGNADDPEGTGNGRVDYSYQIGKYDVTIGQYAAFLNAVAATDTYSLYNASMETDPWVAGISRTGLLGAYVYSVIGPAGFVPASGVTAANRPITYVSWFDAARLAN